MTRHLEREGVTFKDPLREAPLSTALQYLEQTSLDAQQNAFLLGYSVTAAFSRAFARLAVRPPTEHRRSHRQARQR